MRQMQRRWTHQRQGRLGAAAGTADAALRFPSTCTICRRCSRGLPEEERVAMVLSYAHGYSHSEIALVTGLPIGTVKSKLNRAKARILERIEMER